MAKTVFIVFLALLFVADFTNGQIENQKTLDELIEDFTGPISDSKSNLQNNEINLLAPRGIFDSILKLIVNLLDKVLKIINGIVGLGGDLIGNILKGIGETLPKIIDDLLESIDKAIEDAATESIRNALQSLFDLITGQVDIVRKLIDDIIGQQGALNQALKDIGEKVRDAIAQITQAARKCIDKIPLQITGIIGKATKALTKCTGGIVNVIGGQLKLTDQIIRKVERIADSILSKVDKCLKNPTRAEKCLAGLEGEIFKALQEIIELLSANNVALEVLGNVEKCVDGVVEVATSEISCN